MGSFSFTDEPHGYFCVGCNEAQTSFGTNTSSLGEEIFLLAKAV